MTMRGMLTTLLVALILLGVLVYNSLYIVHQNEQALVLNFGKPSATISEPGLQWLIPVAQNAVIFDKRLLNLDTQPLEVLVSDQKRLVVDAFARYRIDDPLKFFKSVGTEEGARGRLSSFIGASLRSTLGGSTIRDVVRDKREDLMRQIGQEVNAKASELGVTVVDVRIKRADFPEQTREAVFSRMKTERNREAAEWRAKGEEQSRIIKADANRQVVVLTARATQDSESTRGEGEANSNTVQANAYSKDADFFAFYRTMKAYEDSLQAKDTRLLLSPDSEFFKYFADPNGKAPPAK